MRRALLVAVLVACVPAPAAAAPLANTGRWMHDSEGRVVVLHGVAINQFKEPWLPEAAGFGEDDARFLKAHGFNIVRLGFTWAGAEPKPGMIDREYVRSLARSVRLLGRYGIYSLLDAHQDGYGKLTGTDGAPDWAVRADGLPNNRIAFGIDYFANPAVLRSFDNLYANAKAPDGVGLADHFGAMWAAIAKEVRDEPRLLGYELINEPHPGTQYPACLVVAGCPLFDRTLAAFYRRVTGHVRKADAGHFVFYEPHLFFDFGVDTTLRDASGGHQPQGFAFHDYCLGAGAGDALPALPAAAPLCPIEEKLVIDNANRQGVREHQAVINTEWAATDDLATTKRVADLLDDGRVPWTFWAYNSRRLVADPTKAPAGANLNAGAIDILDRPYPRVVAGTPQPWRWDAAARVFTLRYAAKAPSPLRPAPGALTEVWVGPQHFRSGYRAEVQGGTLASEANSPALRIRTRAGAAEVRVRVAAGTAASCKDRTPPRPRIDRRSRVNRRGVRLRGSARDAGCAGSETVHPVFGRVARLRVSVQRRAGSRCRFLTRNGRLTGARACGRPVWITVRPRVTWTLRVAAARLPRGSYRVQVRATDSAGNSRVVARSLRH